ncbi:MAG: hypothetical protein NVV68_07370 [Dokdonella sp.]|nr:hypothetical protein [Dokdonella sp.]
MKYMLVAILLLLPAVASATHVTVECVSCGVASPIPDGKPSAAGTTLATLENVRLEQLATYGFAIGDSIMICNATVCVNYIWDGPHSWTGQGQQPRQPASNPPGGGGTGGGPGTGGGTWWSLVSVCGYVNGMLDICLLLPGSQPGDPPPQGDVN